MNSVKRRLSAIAPLFLGQEKTSTSSNDFKLTLAAWTGIAGNIRGVWAVASADITNASGSTSVLALAVWNMHDDVVISLLRSPMRDFPPRVYRQDPYSALHLAAWNDDGGMIKRLLEVGAEISAQDKNGLTPLHWAARYGNIEAIRVLISSGADVDIRDHEGWPPIQLAEIHGQIDAMGILSQARMKRFEEMDTTLAQVDPTTRIGSRENGSANSHPEELPKNGSQKVRVTGKSL